MTFTIHLHCLVLDGVYRNSEGTAVFHEVAAPAIEELQALLAKIITRIMRLLTRQGFLIEEGKEKGSSRLLALKVTKD